MKSNLTWKMIGNPYRSYTICGVYTYIPYIPLHSIIYSNSLLLGWWSSPTTKRPIQHVFGAAAWNGGGAQQNLVDVSDNIFGRPFQGMRNTSKQTSKNWYVFSHTQKYSRCWIFPKSLRKSFDFDAIRPLCKSWRLPLYLANLSSTCLAFCCAFFVASFCGC